MLCYFRDPEIKENVIETAIYRIEFIHRPENEISNKFNAFHYHPRDQECEIL